MEMGTEKEKEKGREKEMGELGLSSDLPEGNN